MVIYFTGTGSSEYAAKAIADRLGDETLCANHMIKKNESGSFREDPWVPWVFVFPVYLSTMPAIFMNFIRNIEFRGSKKAYFIACCASAIGSAPNRCADLCVEKQFEYMGTAMIQMPQNYIALFKMTEPDEIKRRLMAALTSADEISEAISAERPLGMKLASKPEYFATKMVEKMYNGTFTGTKKFFAADSCIGCGICVKNCPLNIISLSESGKPKWTGSCIHCMACINRCPKQAIEYGKNTAGKIRYVCEEYQPKNNC